MRIGISSLLMAMAVAVLQFGCVSPSRHVGVRHPYSEPMGLVPRWIFLPEVANCRDMGGWTVDGGVVRQGMIYRSGCLNRRWRWYNAFSQDFLSEETRHFVNSEMRVRTEIDLRKVKSCRGMHGSPLGANVKFVNVPFKAYELLDSAEGRDAFKRVFKVFLERENYPILFHCEGGNDRAGTLAFILEGLLGVGEAELRREWELSRLWTVGDHFSYDLRLVRLERMLDRYPGGSLNGRIEAFVRSLGFSSQEIARFREYMIERPSS